MKNTQSSGLKMLKGREVDVGHAPGMGGFFLEQRSCIKALTTTEVIRNMENTLLKIW
jgi:hypothetical protein